MHRVKGIDFLMGYAVACSSSFARVQEFLTGKLQVCKVLGAIHYFPGVPLANFYGNLYNMNVVFEGMKVRTPCLHSDPHMLLLSNFLHILTYFSLCVKPLKSARDQSHDIFRLELGKVKNTTFLVKRKFLFLRTI